MFIVKIYSNSFKSKPKYKQFNNIKLYSPNIMKMIILYIKNCVNIICNK